MDFLNPKKRRAHRRRLLIGYVLIGVAIAAGTLILVLQANGYDINRKNGQVIQNGLVFVDSKPVVSNISVNGVNKGQTNQRLILQAGQYHMQLKRDGFRSWKKDINLDGGGVEHVTYPFLFPIKLTPKEVILYGSQPTFVSSSPDHHWLLIQQPGKLESFDIVDLNNATNPVATITLPPGLMTASGGSHVLELVEWSNDNRHILLKHTFSSGNEFIVVDRESAAASLNLNKLFSLPLTKVTLQDKQPDQFYLFDSATGTLRTADAKNRAVTLLIDKVLDFHSNGQNQIVYVSDDGTAGGTATVKLRNGNNSVNLRQIDKTVGYLLDMAKFDNHWYVVFGTQSDKKLYIYKDPQSFNQKIKTLFPVAYRALRLDVDSQFVSFSANAQFIALQGGSRFAVYDLENNRQYRYDSGLKLPAGYKVTWMDSHRLIASSEGVLTAFEYDNLNKQILVAGDTGLVPSFDRNFEVLYSVGPSTGVPGRQALTRSSLK